MTVRPFLSPRTSAKIGELARRGFATALAVADAEHTVATIYRRDPVTGEPVPVVTGGAFLATIDNRLAREVREEGIEGRVISGRIQRFAPDDPDQRLRIGDGFDLPRVGPATIAGILPDEYGIEQATWTAEGGAA